MKSVEHEIRLGYKASASSKSLIIMCGWPGSGKSTIARRLANGLEHSTIIKRDDLRDFISSSGFINPIPDGKIVETDAHLYMCAELLLRGKENLLQEVNTLIIDGTFHSFKKRNHASYFAQEQRCEMMIVHCVCSHETALRRLRKQIADKEKVFKYPPEEVVEFYENRFDQLLPEEMETAVIKINTEDDYKPTIIHKPLMPSSPFVQNVIDIFELPILF